MEENKTNQKPTFSVIRKLEPYKLKNAYVYISEQEIKQPNGNASSHIVLNKQSTNPDGSPRGNSKQLFIPKESSKELLQLVVGFIDQE